jgi:hypothetical protein
MVKALAGSLIAWAGRLCAAALLLAVVAPAGPARAAVVWSWSFSPQEYIVEPGETFSVTAALTAAPQSDPFTITGISLNISYNDADFSSVVFLPNGNSELDGQSLAPGGSLTFTLADLTLSADAPPGPIPLFTSVNFGINSFPLMAPAGGLLPTISNGPAVGVPEPASLALFGAGLLGLAAVRHRRARGRTSGGTAA